MLLVLNNWIVRFGGLKWKCFCHYSGIIILVNDSSSSGIIIILIKLWMTNPPPLNLPNYMMLIKYRLLWCFYGVSSRMSLTSLMSSTKNLVFQDHLWAGRTMQRKLLCFTFTSSFNLLNCGCSKFFPHLYSESIQRFIELNYFSLGLDYMGSGYVIDTAESLLITISATFTDCSCSCCKFCFCSNNVNLNPLRLCCLCELSQATKV